MYRNQLRSERFDAHATTARRPGFGCGSHHWVVSGGSRSAAPAARPQLPSNRSANCSGSFRRPGSLQQYQPRSAASTVPEGNGAVYAPVVSAPHAESASHGSSDSKKPAGKPTRVSCIEVGDAPASESAEGVSDSSTPATPPKDPGNSSTGFTLQFGTLSPGVIDKQFPPRTTSPPDLDEREPEQAHHGLSEKSPMMMTLSPKPEHQNQEATNNLALVGQTHATNKHENAHVPVSSTTSVVPMPALHRTSVLNSVPPSDKVHTDSCKVLPRSPSSPSEQQKQQKQELRKDAVDASQSDAVHIYPTTKPKISVRVPVSYTPSNTAQSKSFVLPVPKMPLPVAFQQKQPQISMDLRGPSMQMQSIGSVPNSLPVKMAVPMGNAPLIQPLFVHGAQPPALRQQTFLHQGQGLGYLPPASHHLDQFGNLRVTPELSPQQPRSSNAHKSTVKITHPETHEELMLDRRGHSYKDFSASGQMPLYNVNQLPQPIQTFSPLHKAYYPLQPNSYIPSPVYFPTTTAIPPLTNRQMSPRMQVLRHSFDLSNSSQPITSINSPMLNPWPCANSRPPINSHVASEGSGFKGLRPSTPVHVVVKAPNSLLAEKNEVSPQRSIPTCTAETTTLLRYSGEPALPHQQIDCKLDLGISPEAAKVVSKGACKVPVVATNKISCTTPQTVPTLHAQTEMSLAAHATPVAGSGSATHSNFPSAYIANSTSSAKAKPVGIEESPGPAAASSSNTKCELSQVVPLQSDALPANGASTKFNDIVSKVASLGSNADGTLLTNMNSKNSGDGILGKPPLLHTQEMLPAKLQSSNISAEAFSKANAYPVPFQEVSEVNGPVPFQNQDMIREEQTVNAKVMCSRYKKEQVDVSIPAAICRVENGCDVSKSVRSHTCPDLANLHSFMSIADIPSSNKNIQPSSIDPETGNSEPEDNQNSNAIESAGMLQDAALVSYSINSPSKDELEGIVEELPSPFSVTAPMMHTKKGVLEATKAKTTRGRRKKRKEMLSRTGSNNSSDLCNVYISQNESFVSSSTPESISSTLTADVKQQSTLGDAEKDILISENDSHSRSELFNWEGEAEISTKKLERHEFKHPVSEADVHKDEYGSVDRKKYTQDFLLTFAQSCIHLPVGFKIGSDIANAVMSVLVGAPFIVNREHFPSRGRMKDNVLGTPRVDHRMASKLDGDRWTKLYPSFNPGRDALPETFGPANTSWDSAQRAGHGFSKSHSHNQSSIQYTGEILSKAMKAVVSQRSITRNSVDERWRHGTNVHGVPVPASRVSMPLMHKAEKKYEVGKVSDEEEAKQRQLKAILNKLTPQNFEKLFAQVKELNIDNVVTLTGVISQIFDKALMEPTFCEMYASFCFCMAGELPYFGEDDEKITFKRLLLNKCQEEFERGEREQVEADKTEEEGGIKQSKGEREEKRLRARRRMLGNIRLIGELYKKKMLTERIMHECIKKLLGEYQNPDEEDLEALCKLMSTIGEMIDHPRAKVHMDAYFDIIVKLSANPKLSSRVSFMLEDMMDLRKNMWRQRRKVEGPKKIEEVHRDAVKQKLGQSARLGSSSYCSSAPSSHSAVRSRPPSDHGIRGSPALASRGSSQVRAYGVQDVHLDGRYQPANRTSSVPLQQRRAVKSIRLGPQDDLGREMHISGKQPIISNAILPEVPSNSHHGQTSHNSTEGSFTEASNNRANLQVSTDTPANQSWRTLDHPFPRLVTAVHPVGQVHTSSTSCQDICLETITLPEEVLQEKSILTIREFYSAKDEKEVAMCMKELNAPSFYPSLVSLWINDSFERKDMERELLAKLLVDLCKSQESLLSQKQLLQGLQSVLSTLADAVTDAPRAAEFLGRIFAKIIVEDVISLREIGRLLQDDGGEPVHMLEPGFASKVRGSMLESIRVEKGDSAVDEIRARSNLRLEDCRRPGVCV